MILLSGPFISTSETKPSLEPSIWRREGCGSHFSFRKAKLFGVGEGDPEIVPEEKARGLSSVRLDGCLSKPKILHLAPNTVTFM
jgi:hypothetical protein